MINVNVIFKDGSSKTLVNRAKQWRSPQNMCVVVAPNGDIDMFPYKEIKHVNVTTTMSRKNQVQLKQAPKQAQKKNAKKAPKKAATKTPPEAKKNFPAGKKTKTRAKTYGQATGRGSRRKIAQYEKVWDKKAGKEVMKRVATHASAKAAERTTGICQSTISRAVRHQYEIVGGYYWIAVDEIDRILMANMVE